MSDDLRRTTIIDVARHAGVSTKTVSRVLNDKPHVTEAVRSSVLAAIEAVRYYPNVLARALVQGRSNLIGLVYENPSPSYVVDLQKGVLHRLLGERYRLVVVPIESVAQREGEVVGLLRSAALDGVVLAPPASDSRHILDALAAAGIAFARIAPTSYVGAGPSNLIDDVAAAREIASHVIELGHKEIAIIEGDPTHPSSLARSQGYSEALGVAGLTVRPDRIEQGFYTYESGYQAAVRLLGARERPTAILAQNDDMAVGALVAAREAGLAVPEQISIAGFDDAEVSRIAWPPITTIRQPVFDMAFVAAGMVIAQMEGTAPEMCRQHRHELLIRKSTGVVPTRHARSDRLADPAGVKGEAFR
jgi:LacI family transcriptional regulator